MNLSSQELSYFTWNDGDGEVLDSNAGFSRTTFVHSGVIGGEFGDDVRRVDDAAFAACQARLSRRGSIIQKPVYTIVISFTTQYQLPSI